MKLSIQINPLKTISENELRSLPMVVANVARRHGAQKALGVAQGIAGRVRKQRAYVRAILDAELPRLRRELQAVDIGTFGAPFALNGRDRANFFRVTLIRISAGTLDEGSVASALKAVQDEVAAWLGIDDGPRAPASWRYGQQRGPQKIYAVRIEIEDDDPDPRATSKVVGQPIPRLGPVVGDVQHAPRATAHHEHDCPNADDYTGNPGDRMQGPAPRRRSWDPRDPLSDGRPQEQAPGGVLRVGHGLSRPGNGTVAQVASGLGLTEKALRTLAPMKCRLLDRGDKRIAEQAPLIFRRAFAIIPEEQDDASEEWTLRELTMLPGLDALPPPRISVAGRIYIRRLDSTPALGEHWIYEVAPSAAPAQESRETR